MPTFQEETKGLNTIGKKSKMPTLQEEAKGLNTIGKSKAQSTIKRIPRKAPPAQMQTPPEQVQTPPEQVNSYMHKATKLKCLLQKFSPFRNA